MYYVQDKIYPAKNTKFPLENPQNVLCRTKRGRCVVVIHCKHISSTDLISSSSVMPMHGSMNDRDDRH